TRSTGTLMSLPRAEVLGPESFPYPLPEARRVASPTRLRGQWLVVARVTWLVTTLLTVGLYIVALPARQEELRVVCSANPCGDRIRPEWLQQLHALGLSVTSYAAFQLTVEVGLVLAFLAVAVLIAALRSDDWLALLGALTLVTFGTATISGAMTSLVAQSPAWWLPVAAVSFLGSVAITAFFYFFPDGRFVPGWTRWLVAAWVVLEAARY